MKTTIEAGLHPMTRGTIEISPELEGGPGGRVSVVGVRLEVRASSPVISALDARLLAGALLAYADLASPK